MKRILAAILIAGLSAGSLTGCLRTGTGTAEAPAAETEAAAENAVDAEAEDTPVEEAPQLDEAARTAAEDLLAQAVDKSLIETRLESAGSLALRTLTYGEKDALSETIYLAGPDTYSAISYTDGAVTYCEIMRDGEDYYAAPDETGAMQVVDLIFADEKDWKRRVAENHDLWSFAPLADEVITACEESGDTTVVTTELTDPETVEGILAEAGADAFIYRTGSRLVSTYTISADGIFTAAQTDYVLEDGTVIPFERTEFEADTAQQIRFPFEELGAGIDPNVTRKITLVFYPGTEMSFTTIKVLPQHMNMTPVLPGDIGYDIYTNEACTDVFPGSDGIVNLTLYIVPNEPLPVEEEATVVYDDIEAEGDISEDQVKQFSALLTQNLVSSRVSSGASLGMNASYTTPDGKSRTLTAGCSADRHWIEAREGDAIVDACLFEDSTVTYNQVDDAGTSYIGCDVFESDDNWHAAMLENEDSLSTALMAGEILTSIETTDEAIVAVTEMTDEESIRLMGEAGIHGSGLTFDYTEGDTYRFTYTFDAESGAFISQTGTLVRADGTESDCSSISVETDYDVASYAFPYAELDGAIDPANTRTFTMVLDPGMDENITISKTLPKFVAILPVIGRESYTIYADEACTQEYTDTVDDLESDITIYIR